MTKACARSTIGALVAVALLFFGARAIPALSIFEPDAPDGLSLPAHDDWVHYHRAELVGALGRFPDLDSEMAYPDGLRLHWPHTYAVVLGMILAHFGPTVLALLPLLGGVATAFAAAAGARRIGIAPAGSAAYWSVLPAGIYLTCPGALDHHAWEAALLWFSIIQFEKRPVLSGILAGAAWHVTPSAPVMAVGYLISLAVHGLLERKRGKFLAGKIENAVLAAVAVALPSGTEIAAFDAPSLLQFFALAGAGFFLASLFSDPATRWSRLAIALCFLLAVGVTGLDMARDAFSILFKADPWLKTVEENRSILHSPVGVFQVVQYVSVGFLALPFWWRRIPAPLFFPALFVFLITALQLRFLGLVAVPAAWSGLLLIERVAQITGWRSLAAAIGLGALLLTPSIRPVIASADIAPGIPAATHELLSRAARRFDSQDVVLARWDLAGHIVGMTRASTIADAFHRNPQGRQFWRAVMLGDESAAERLLRARGVSAIIVTDPLDGFLATEGAGVTDWNATFVSRLWQGKAAYWKLADETATARLYVRSGI